MTTLCMCVQVHDHIVYVCVQVHDRTVYVCVCVCVCVSVYFYRAEVNLSCYSLGNAHLIL